MGLEWSSAPKPSNYDADLRLAQSNMAAAQEAIRKLDQTAEEEDREIAKLLAAAESKEEELAAVKQQQENIDLIASASRSIWEGKSIPAIRGVPLKSTTLVEQHDVALSALADIS